MADAGSFFENEPVVIDASRVDGLVDWPALLEALRGHICPPSAWWPKAITCRPAKAAGLIPVELSTPPARPTPADAGNHAAAPCPPEPAAALTAAAPAPRKAARTVRRRPPMTTPPAKRRRRTTNPTRRCPGRAGRRRCSRGQDRRRSPPFSAGKAAAAARPGRPSRNGIVVAGAVLRACLRAARETTSSPRRPIRNRRPPWLSAAACCVPRQSASHARHTDLVVIGMVRSGGRAEASALPTVSIAHALSTGCAQRKRWAGARGDASARIFTTHLWTPNCWRSRKYIGVVEEPAGCQPARPTRRWSAWRWRHFTY